MSDFSQVRRYLSLNKSRKATVQEARNHSPSFEKYYSYARSRDIKRIYKHITLPAFINPIAGIVGYPVPRLVFQYNVTMPADFYLTDVYDIKAHDYSNVVSGRLNVKWRNGTVVNRYALGGFIGVGAYRLADYTPYAGQKIGKNCVFEYILTVNDGGFFNTYGLDAPLSLRTSLLREPETAEDTLETLMQGVPKTLLELGYFLEFAPPQPQPTIAWLDN